MNNSIVDKQNSSSNLKKLAAQRELYSSAKRLLAAQIFFTIVLVTFISFLNLYVDLEVFLGTYSIIITLLDIGLLNRLINRKKELAAKIQEMFDTEVLSIEWNDIISRTDHELIFRYSKKYEKDNDYEALKNWYPEIVSKLDKDIAKIVCQRANCRYDSSIRKCYTSILIGFVLILIIVVFVLGILKGVTLDNFVLLLLLPALPMINFCLEQYYNNKEKLESLARLKSKLDDAWDKLVSEDIVDNNKLSRQIQNRIYLNRQNSPLVFDWIYIILRNRLEEEMTYSVEVMVETLSRR